jgi:hypothetical protein
MVRHINLFSTFSKLLSLCKQPLFVSLSILVILLDNTKLKPSAYQPLKAITLMPSCLNILQNVHNKIVLKSFVYNTICK